MREKKQMNLHTSGYAKDAEHYKKASKQPIELMHELLTHEQFIGFLHGNIIKYALRLGYKDDRVKEAEKIEQYAHWLVSLLKEDKIEVETRKEV